MKVIDLFESNVNSHINHVEELVLDGKTGINDAIKILYSVYGLLTTANSNSTFVSQKFDGIAIVFGIDPVDKKFFVGTKSVFSLTPKVIKSEKDLEIYYSDQKELADKLRICLRNLRTLGISGIFQGDLLFTSNTLKSEKINNEEMVIFNPNTISYAVPLTNKISKDILRSNLGIAVHTSYHGTIGNLVSYSYPKLGQIKSNRNVWVKPVTYDNYSAIQLSENEKESILDDFELIQGLVRSLQGNAIEKVLNYKDLRENLRSWINQIVRDKSYLETSTSIKEFYRYVISKEDLVVKSYKTQNAKDKKVNKLDELKNFLVTNKSAFESIIRIHILIDKIKRKLLARLNTIEELGTFIKTDDGYKVTNPEGFVAIGETGNMVKLVDRLEFSHLNFKHGAPWKKV